MNKPDILVFLSDQHSYATTGFGGNAVVRTPCLDAIVREGVSFDCTYCACPLCVPSRMSMLSGILPSESGIFDNSGALPSDQATFLHALANVGYETVLCGRMHFLGPDQRHGFTKRIAGDITPLTWGNKHRMQSELGVFNGSLAEKGCLKIAGSGTSPVLEYDKMVINQALEYLSQSHEKPQCIVIGTYAPHFPYVAPEEVFEHYLHIIQVEENEHPLHPALKHKQQDCDKDTLKRIVAAYYGMVETMDRQIGLVYERWQSYLAQNDRKGVFAYLSDHGDMLGDRRLFGKKSLYDNSSRVPMIFVGDHILQGKRMVEPVSLLDVGSTLCNLAGTDVPPLGNGISLVPWLSGCATKKSRYVISEVLDKNDKEIVLGRMVRQGRWKLISYKGYEGDDCLFDLETDAKEARNCIKENPAVYQELQTILKQGWNTESILDRYTKDEANHRVLETFGRLQDKDDSERWTIPYIEFCQ